VKRRALLRTVGASGVAGTTAFAGCIGMVMTASTAEIVGQDEVPEKYGVSIDVELVNSEYTDEHPVRLRTTVTNHDRERLLSLSGNPKCGLFDRGKAGSDPPGLWVFSPDTADFATRKDGRWVRDRESDHRRAFALYACTPETYAADESRSQVYEVWDDYRTEDYLVPNTYRWEDSVDVADGDEGWRDWEPNTFQWGFSLDLD
jgi:hypothetical protein